MTTPNYETAEKLANGIVDNKIAACVNIFPNITSIYRWNSKVEKDQECFMMVKTTSRNIEPLKNYIKNNHPYENPECIGFKVESGIENYTKWILDSVRSNVL